MAAASFWLHSECVADVLQFLDVPSRVRCAQISKNFLPPQTAGMALLVERDAATRLACPMCYTKHFLTAAPTWAILSESSRYLWELVARPLLDLSGRVLACPCVEGDVLVEVHILGWHGCCDLSSAGWRALLHRFELPACQAAISELVTPYGWTPADIPLMFMSLNPTQVPLQQSMAAIDQGSWTFHWFPYTFQEQEGEPEYEAAVLEFNTYGVCGVLHFTEVLWHAARSTMSTEAVAGTH